MAFGLEELAATRQAEVEKALDESRRARTDAEALQVLLSAMDSIREEIANQVTTSTTIDNFDEVQAALRNELNRISKPIISAIEKLELSKDKVQGILNNLSKQNILLLDKYDDIQIIRKPRQKITVDNLGDILFPETSRITNLDDLKKYFDELMEVVKTSMQVTVEAPSVVVNPPDIRIPEISVPTPSVSIDLEKVIAALDPLKFLSDRAKKPLAVRLSDGAKFIQTLKTLVDNQSKQMAAFSNGLNESSLTKAFKRALDGGIKYAKIDAASIGDNTLVAAVAGKKIRVISLLLVSAGDVNVRFESGASGTALTGQMNLIASTGFSLNWNPSGWFETAAGALLNLELSGAISVDGTLSYTEV